MTRTPLGLPDPRGPLSAFVLETVRAGRPLERPAPVSTGSDDGLGDDDLHFALYLCYELHDRGLPGVTTDEVEWDPCLLAFRSALERRFAAALRSAVGPAPTSVLAELVPRLVESAPGRSLSAHFRDVGTLEQMREFVVHRSPYQLKEADPHTWALPRLGGAAKQRLAEIQAGEYGVDHGGHLMHATLFAAAMRALDLDDRPNAHLTVLAEVTFGIAAALVVEDWFAESLLRPWAVGDSSLRPSSVSVPGW